MKKYKNNEAIYQILCLIDHHYELGTNPNFLDDPIIRKIEISEKRINLIIVGLLNSGYIEGTPVYSSIYTKEIASLTYPKLTISGMNYLIENSAMRKAMDSVKLIADVINAVKL